ncbi:hypothetical protein [Rhodopseudomonas palustris]|uniref:hypothetical protein n=1 Tax=Rhodopseudomonas palustris TaxID=1076 RepID=UPI0021F3B2C3|nr:hypothetical protein [Rhodopseudomonas palustris]UYO53624.1 hypothetical protein KQX61_24100 [Rhodopseudomonas palustris]
MSESKELQHLSFGAKRMASSLKDWVAHKYRSVRKRGLRQAVKTADNPIRENLDVAREALRISHEILCNNSEMRNVIDETRNRGRDAIDIIEEIRRHNNETRDIIDEIRNRGRDTIDIVDEIRNRSRDTIDIVAELRRLNDAHDDRLRRLELYMLHLMKQAGIALETLSVEASDSQRPAIKGEMRFVKLEITKGSVIKNINRIRALTELQCRDADFLEHTLIPELGLAEEDWAFPRRSRICAEKDCICSSYRARSRLC